MIVNIALPIGPSVCLAHRAIGVEALGQAAKADAARGQLLDDGEDMLGIATEPVELPHREDIAFAKVAEAGV
jgi:stage V sporulation protein SpoVS